MQRYYLLQSVLDNRTRRGHTPTTPHSRSIDLNLTYLQGQHIATHQSNKTNVLTVTLQTPWRTRKIGQKFILSKLLHVVFQKQKK